jgi:hypothetical protein
VNHCEITFTTHAKLVDGSGGFNVLGMKITRNDSHTNPLPFSSPFCTALQSMNTAVQRERERRFHSDFILFKLNGVPPVSSCISVSSWWRQAGCCLHPLWLVFHRFFNLSARPSAFSLSPFSHFSVPSTHCPCFMPGFWVSNDGKWGSEWKKHRGNYLLHWRREGGGRCVIKTVL